ncbi:DUF4836 family protein [uncultured Bacteroides sp.]|uniref:DUF4836 family protein n=1 Tax=uncultured Bacteroides sp. TaxID=162156 RepID=UPI002AAA7B1B|nr:DUF4836 family protein [uncultured Bacteroides sp.]
MKRKNIYQSLMLLLLVAFLAACSKKTDYTNVIPADASAVAGVNLKSLATKSGLNDVENKEFKQKLTDAIKNGLSATAFKQMEKIIDNPIESGIDFSEPIYFFTARTLPFPALTMKVSDIEKVHATLEAMASEHVCQPTVKVDGYDFTTFADGTLCAYTKNTMLIVSSIPSSQVESVKKTLSALIKQDAEKSVVKNKGFIKMREQKGDLIFFASMRDLPSSYAKQIKFGLSEELDMSQLFILGDLNFEKGKISLKYETYTEDKELLVQLKKQEKAFGTLKGSLISHFPASSVAYMTVNTKGEDFYKLLSENKGFLNSFIGAERSEIKKLITHIDGEVAVAVTGVSLFGMPSFIAYAEINDEVAISALKKYAALSRMPMYVGQSGKSVYITNDKNLMALAGKKQEESLKEATFASNIKGNAYYMVINAEALLKLPLIKSLSNFGEEFGMYHNLASQISYMEFRGVSNGKGEVNLALQNKDKNALKQIVGFAKQFIGLQ